MAMDRLQATIEQLLSGGKPAPPKTAFGRLESAVEWARTSGLQSLRDANPLNVVLALVAAYLLYKLVMPYSVVQLTPSLAKARSPGCNANTSYSFLPDNHPPQTVWKKYTPRTLAVHDGSAAKPSSGQAATEKGAKTPSDNAILLAIDGRVFDVTKGANFYGPGGPYGNFAGRDASRGMAKQSFDLEMLTPLDQPIDKLSDLTPMEVNNMREWVSHFSGKYTIVGELVNEGEQGDGA